MRLPRPPFAVAFWWCLLTLGPAAAAPPARFDATAAARGVEARMAEHGDGAVASVWLGGGVGGPWLEVGPTGPRPTASSVKSFFLVELFAAYAGKPGDPLPGGDAVLDDDRHPAISHFTAAQRDEIRRGLRGASVRKIGEVMIGKAKAPNAVYNAAANLVTAVLGGPEALTKRIHAREPAFQGVAVRRYMLRDRTVTGDNEAPAAALAALYQRLAAKSLRGIDDKCMAEIRRVLLRREDAALGSEFAKAGALASDPLTEVRSGWWETPRGVIVYVVMLSQPTPGGRDRITASARLARTADAVTEFVVHAARAAEPGVRIERIIGPEVPHRYKHPAAVTQLDNGDLLLAYHGGSGEYDEDTAVYATRLKAGEATWSRPAVIADTPFHGDGNPVVWQGPGGRVWLFYVVRYGKTWSDSRIQCKVSDDGAKTWTDPFVLAFEPGMMVRNQPIVLADGDYLLPVYHEKGSDPEVVGPDSTSLFLRYNPKTKAWTRTLPIRSRNGNIQPAVAQVSADHLVCFCRRGGGYDGRPDGRIVFSESRDGGRTWAPGRNSEFPNPNAAVDLLRLKSGNLLLVYNDSTRGRTPLTVALSTDGGKTFPHRRNIKEGPGGDFAYPYTVQTRDGAIHVVFTSDRRTVVNRAVFDETWLLAAAPHREAAPPPAPAGGAPRHVKVYAEPGRFGGWPANHGIWAWGDEILVGFSAGYAKDNGPGRHAIDHARPEEHLLARSRDGGRTWAIENPAAAGALIPVGPALHGVTPPGLTEKPWQDCPGGIDFTHPDFALTVRMTDVNAGPSRFSYSTDRGKTWQGPYRLPLFDQPGIAARTDYVVNGRDDCLLFLTAAKADRREGRPLCVRTTDGGRTWNFVSWIADEPKGYAIMPATVRLGGAELLTAVRHREGAKSWVETYRSRDDGRTWRTAGVPCPDLGEGNPASLIRLADGRLCLTYGYRAAPYGIRARLSRDGGHTWGEEIVLRADGGGRDLGYPRSVQRPDGKVVTVYYFHDQPRGDRYIAATIWEPGETGR